ncbi:LANO_0G06898g1_1 [Lachancea nothofagi CBS 11611]|uniref:LANO_0G06898g1_1 n=1 Tax=Lachancea nothofagi CBS 11611 TaxID=1266666 RepID=A0A1G4KHM8_9SACH|nr:LANO_0G06898g1_1 [Lachancea nothofagi CBS 11611]
MSCHLGSKDDVRVSEELATVDSLLSEIEKEIPLVAKRQIPLHEIGDETMDIIVTHNTRSNSSLGKEVLGAEPEKPLVEGRNRKSVMFSNSCELHEYPDAESSTMDDTLTSPVAWSLSGAPKLEGPQNKTLDFMFALDQDDRDLSGSSDSSFQLTKAELLEKSITNLPERLGHVLDGHTGSPNIPKLKEMVNDIDQLAFAPSETHTETQPLKITFESTPPLIGNGAEQETLEFDLQSQESEEEIPPRVRHSPSKIPTTSTIRINRLGNDESLNAPQPSRVSSGSSMDESVTDLETTMKQDKFNLLRTSVPLRASDPFDAHEYQVSNKSLILHDTGMNDSRVFSMATTADEFQSAKESTGCSSSAYGPEDLESIEDLQISAGLVREDETLRNIDQIIKNNETCPDEFSTALHSKNKPLLHQEDTSYKKHNVVKSTSSSTVRVSSLQELGSCASDSNLNQTNIEEAGFYASRQVNDMKDRSEESAFIAKDQGNTTVAQNENSEAGSAVNSELNDNDAEDKLSDSNMSYDTSESKELQLEQCYGAEVRTERNISMTERKISITETMNGKELLSDTRVVSDNFSKIFDDDAIFGDVNDTSQDSVDIINSLKPNYLSIWRCQEETSKPSPSFSSNSQFSQRSNGTSDSSQPGQLKFKLKPRIVSRSKIYYPHHKRSENSSLRSEVFIPRTSSSSILDPLYSQETRKVLPHVSGKVLDEPQVPSIARIALDYHEKEGSKDTVLEKHSGLSAESEAESPGETSPKTSELADVEKPADVTITSERAIESDEDESKLKYDSFELPDISGGNFDMSEDFGDILNAVNYDNWSLKDSDFRKDRDPTIYHIWDENNYQNGIDFSLDDDTVSETKKRLNDEVLTKLLSEDPKLQVEDNDNSALTGLGILKNADSDVAICRAESIKGFEVIRSASSETVEHNRELFEPHQTPPPVKKTHIESPFKTVRARNANVTLKQDPKHVCGNLESATDAYDGEVESMSRSAAVTDQSSVQSSEALKSSQMSDLEDHGKFYIMVKSVKNLQLNDIPRHKAEIAMEFDNGINVVQTPWKQLNRESIDMSQEYELIMKDKCPELSAQIIVTLKCKYSRPASELVEVTEHLPIKKKFPFGKTKYTLNRKFVNKKVEIDNWDYKFAQDGSFARCDLSLNADILKQTTYRRKKFDFSLYNEWERISENSGSGRDLHSLPRKAAYKIGELEVEMSFLPRTSNFEKFPKTLKLAQEIVDKFAEQQEIKFEGFMWQEGGDIDGLLQKRYFVLKGTQLIAHHEITHKPQALINLLKVVGVMGEGQLTEETVQKVRNFTDIVLFSECFKLIFENGEIINLDAESSDLKAKWTEIITRVVELNKFHQPWVKHVLNNRLLSV